MHTNRPTGLFLADLPSAEWVQYVRSFEDQVLQWNEWFGSDPRLEIEAPGAEPGEDGYKPGCMDDDYDALVTQQNEGSEATDFDPLDPKSEGYHERMADIWDSRDR